MDGQRGVRLLVISSGLCPQDVFVPRFFRCIHLCVSRKASSAALGYLPPGGWLRVMEWWGALQSGRVVSRLLTGASEQRGSQWTAGSRGTLSPLPVGIFQGRRGDSHSSPDLSPPVWTPPWPFLGWEKFSLGHLRLRPKLPTFPQGGRVLGHVLSFLLATRLPGHLTDLGLPFKNRPNSFPKQPHHLAFPPAVREASASSLSSSTLVIVRLFNHGRNSRPAGVDGTLLWLQCAFPRGPSVLSVSRLISGVPLP